MDEAAVSHDGETRGPCSSQHRGDRRGTAQRRGDERAYDYRSVAQERRGEARAQGEVETRQSPCGKQCRCEGKERAFRGPGDSHFEPQRKSLSGATLARFGDERQNGKYRQREQCDSDGEHGDW